MAIYGNFKGTTQSAFQIGKTGGSIHSSTSQPVSPSAGDLWIDSSNTAVRVYDGADWDNGQFIGNLEGYMEYEAQAGEDLVKGDVVYVSGNSGNTPIVSKAQANANGAKMPAFGICTQTISNGSTGYIVTQGLITGINTSAFTSGDTLYVSATTAGELANVSPAGESNKIQNIGKVVKSGNGGSILVGGAGRFNATNALDNGNIFLGDSSNRAVTANLDVSVGSLGFVKSNPGIGGFVYNQSVAANVWSVSHNLGQQYVNVEIIDDTGNSITGTYGYPTINFVNANQLTATFSTPTAGYLVASSGQGYTGSSGAVGFTGSQGFTNFTLAGDTGSDVVNSGETVTMVGATNQIETTVTNNQLSIAIVDGANIANLTVTGNLTSENLSTTGNIDAANINLTDTLSVGAGGSGNGNISGVDVLTAGNIDVGNVNVTDAIVVNGGSGGSISGVVDITASGNIGIGTTSPVSPLHVQADGIGLRLDGTANTSRSIFFRNTTSSNPAQIFTDGSLRLYTEDSGTDIRFHTNSDGSTNERMRIDSSGNVGIGTNSPWSDARLAVDNGGSGAVSIALSRSGSGQNDVALVNDAGEFIVKSGFASTVAGLTEHMRVDASGNVGIGTSSPSDKLHVYSGASGGSPHSYTQLLVENSTHQALEFLSPNTSEQAIWFSDPDTSTVGGFSYYHPTNVLSFRTSNDWRMDLSATSAATTLNILGGSEGLIQFKNGGTVKGYINVPNTRFDVVAGTGSDIRLVPDGAGGKAVTVDTSGNLLVGTTTNPSSGKVAIEYARGTSAGMRIKDTVGAGGTGVIADFYNSSNTSMGAITHDSSNITYGGTSDYRLKENVNYEFNGLAAVAQLKPTKFTWINNPNVGVVYGFIAHEVSDVVGQAVVGEKDAVNEDGSVKPQMLDQSKLIPFLTKAIQEQQAMIEELKAEVAALKGA